MVAKINNGAIEIGIVVRDAERSLAFYRDVLGLPYLGDLDFRAPTCGGSRPVARS